MKCKNCGSELEGRFCSMCGTDNGVQDTENQINDQTAAFEEAPDQQEKILQTPQEQVTDQQPVTEQTDGLNIPDQQESELQEIQQQEEAQQPIEQQIPDQQFPAQQVPYQQLPNQQVQNQQFQNQPMPYQQMQNQQPPYQQFQNQQPYQQYPNQQMPYQQYPYQQPPQKKKLSGGIIALIIIGSIILFFAIIIGSCIGCVACLGNSVQKNITEIIEDESIEVPGIDIPGLDTDSSIYELGDTFKCSDFEITTKNSIENVTLENQYSDLNGSKVMKIPVKIKNLSDETVSSYMLMTESYNPKGVESENVDYYFMETDDKNIKFIGDIRAGAEADGFLYILNEGSGEYVIEFDEILGNKKEVKFSVK